MRAIFIFVVAAACACVSLAEAAYALPQGRAINLHHAILDKARNDETTGGSVAILTERNVALLIPARVTNRDGWAQDIMGIFKAENLAASPENVCSVLAVVQQESGYDPKPKDGNMRRTLDRAIKAKFGAAGALGIKTLLAAKQDEVRKISYWQRIENARSEYDVEHVLHEYSTKFGAGDIYEKLGFFTTAGSMQVSVRFAQDQPMLQGNGEWQIREFLHTRYGGMYIGTLRLLGYPAGYDKPIYRFADYNVGMYASRNAAIQQQVARLTGRRLALDGDLLRYGKNGAAVKEIGESEWAIVYLAGKYAPSLDSRSMRNDMLLEKTMAFENTATYLMVKRAYQLRYGSAPYARLPEVEIKSPKITSKMTTASFAQAVNKKYVKCLGRVSQKNL